jgi:hypothetical protein
MSSESPAAIIYSSLGIEISAPNGSAVASSSQPGLLIDGYNYSTGLAQLVAVNSAGDLLVAGSGTAGSAASGVVTIQGISGMTSVLVNTSSGVFNSGSVSNTGSAAPTPATYVGGSVTTAAPTYSNNTMNALSLTTLGQLRVDGVYPVTTVSTTATDMAQVGGAVTATAPTYTTATTNALSLTTAGALRVDGSSVTQPVTGTGTAGTPATGVVTIQGISGGTAIPVSGTLNIDKSTTGTMTSVSAAISSTTLLASNTNRVLAAIYNNSSNILYVGVSATAVTTSLYTIRIMPNSYWELPLDYTGQINGIWSATGGSANVTEWT